MHGKVVLLTVAVLAVVFLACGGGQQRGGTPGAAPLPPPQPLQPAPAAPAAEPRAAPQPAQAAGATSPQPRAPGASPTLKPKYGGVVRLAQRADLPGAGDPMRARSAVLKNVSGPIFGDGNLVKPCREEIYKLCPGLAEQWGSNSDYTQWTFKVRDGVRWHDGAAFTAEDVKFWADLAFSGYKSGEKVRAPALFKSVFGDLNKVEIVEGNRVRFSLRKPFFVFPHVVGNTFYQIGHPKHLMHPRLEKGEVGVAPLDLGMIGTGPFKMVKYEKGTRIELRRFDQYWEKDPAGNQLPFLDGIEYAIMPDEAAIRAALRTGRLDFTRSDARVEKRSEMEAYLRDLGDKVWFAKVGGSRNGFGFNVLKPGPWQDARVRRAIMLWLDKQIAMQVIADGLAQTPALLDLRNPYTSPDFGTWPGYNPATREKDRAEAKRLMAEAGYPTGGFEMNYLCRPMFLNQCEFNKAQLAGLGINLKLEMRDDAAWAVGRRTLDFVVQSGGLFAQTLPDETGVSMNKYSIAVDSTTKHEDPKVADLYSRLTSSTSVEQRVSLWRELERYLVQEQVYMFPWLDYQAQYPFRSYVKGAFIPVEGPPNNLDHATIWLDK